MKPNIKLGIDSLMMAVLLLLMAYPVTGQELHEWFGAAMLALFVIHSLLNIRWYGNLFRGSYKPLRILQTLINLGVFLSMLCLGFSGIVMSRYVFAALPIHGPAATARWMHMAASYWGFVLMSVHLGMHWSMVMGRIRKLLKGKTMPKVALWMMRLAALVIAGYGAFCFYQSDLLSYMLLRNEFVFFDFEQSAGVMFAEYLSMAGLWILVGFYLTKGAGGKKEIGGKQI